jgi:cytidine deaminase
MAGKKTVDVVMTDLLPVARMFARPPLSNYHVGAVARGRSGALYVGANLEFHGNALNQTVHAEQSALANAFAHRDTGIDAIAVTAAPCGHCRQFLNEIEGASKIKVILAGQPMRALGDLLPAAFGPQDLGMKEGLFSSTPARLHLTHKSEDEVVLAALDAASHAYAPYTNSLAGCAVRTRSGRTFAGSYLENAAFNPSLSPMQSALVNLVVAGEQFAAMTRVVLVEQKSAMISQRPSAEVVLHSIAPGIRVEVFTATAG